MLVTHFHRKPRPLGNFSVESYFAGIRELAKGEITFRHHIAPYFSNGLFKRLAICLEAFLNQSDINHVTGDIHFAAILLNSKKTILTVLDCGALRDVSGFKKALIKFFWFTWPCRHVKNITVISEYTKQDLLSIVPMKAEKIKVIPVFVSDVFIKSEKAFNKVKPNVLQIGTAPNKNVFRTVEALKDISCILTILGKPDQKVIELLQNQQMDFTIVDKAISEKELYELYQQSDIISFVSTLEGFGMPIVEANVVGRVVITSNVTSMPWVAGNAAHLVDPFDVISIKSGFKKIIHEEQYRDMLIEKGYENAKRFNKLIIANSYTEVYKNIYNSNFEN